MTWRVIRGIDYRPAGSNVTVRVEAGETVDDLRPKTAAHFEGRGIVERVDG